MSFSPNFTITKHMLNIESRVSTLKERIEASPIVIQNNPQLFRETVSATVHASTAIEGNPLTQAEVSAVIEGKLVTYADNKSKQEVLNYADALRFISKQTKDKLTLRDILLLHKTVGANDVLERGPIGAFRNYDVVVGYFSPPSYAKVHPLMSDMVQWANSKGTELTAVLSSAIIHFQFETIHPFGDGNGRVGRLLGMWELYRRGFDRRRIFPVDSIFLENRQRYYKALSTAQNNPKDITGWIEFVYEAVDLALERIWVRIQQLPIKNTSVEMILLPKQERLLFLLGNSSMSIAEIQQELHITKAGAHFLIKPLLQQTIIKRIGGHKTGRYILSAKA